jgi:uncharacterized surface protein with fasciclin (FAS1) repeats
MKKIRTLVAGAVGAAVIAGTAFSASPAQASTPSILDIVARSANDNGGGETDSNGRDFDILLGVVQALGLTSTVQGLQNATVFAPADNSFRGLAADLLNVSPKSLTEQQVLDTLRELAKDPKIATALTTTVAYHVSDKENITNLFRRTKPINTFAGPRIQPIPLGIGAILVDRDFSDLDPFTVGQPISASNGTVYVIAGVLRPTDLKTVFPGD